MHVKLNSGGRGSTLSCTDNTCCGLVKSYKQSQSTLRYFNETYLLDCDCMTMAKHCEILPSTRWVDAKVLNSPCVFLDHGCVPTTRQGTSEKCYLVQIWNWFCSMVLRSLVMNSWRSNQTAFLLSLCKKRSRPVQVEQLSASLHAILCGWLLHINQCR